MWSAIKQAVGKDITRIAMPVQFNEPIGFLQVCAAAFVPQAPCNVIAFVLVLC